ncbi:hypothetical protein, partial [Paenibacillus macerans]|uniref:hypothetical protein n=1 Tax=Paenibacillus macerans TaxID=44252 RepID=UPI003D323BCA
CLTCSFRKTDENFFSFLYSLVVQFSKIKLSFFVAAFVSAATLIIYHAFCLIVKPFFNPSFGNPGLACPGGEATYNVPQKTNRSQPSDHG